MLELNQRSANQGSMMGRPQGQNGTQNRQPRRLMLALGLLLIALVALLVKDRTFWFGSEETSIESDMPDATGTSVTKAAPAKSAVSKKQAHKTATQAEPQPVTAQPADAPGLTVTRTVLPP